MNKDKKVIMIVEDEVLLLKAIVKKLTFSGFETISCAGGKQTIDYLKSLSRLPNAIWLDYHLKDMNGLEIMQELKNDKKWQQIPVFVVSNSASQEKVLNMLALGAKKYFLKAEHKLTDIIDVIEKYFESSKIGDQFEEAGISN